MLSVDSPIGAREAMPSAGMDQAGGKSDEALKPPAVAHEGIVWRSRRSG